MTLRFSQRIGKMPIKATIQTESIDEDLKNSLWNVFMVFYLSKMTGCEYVYYSGYKEFVNSLWANFFKLPLDDIPWNDNKMHNIFNLLFMKLLIKSPKTAPTPIKNPKLIG